MQIKVSLDISTLEGCILKGLRTRVFECGLRTIGSSGWGGVVLIPPLCKHHFRGFYDVCAYTFISYFIRGKEKQFSS